MFVRSMIFLLKSYVVRINVDFSMLKFFFEHIVSSPFM